MDEVLFDVGTVVDAEIFAEIFEGKTERVLIIGKRQYNPNSGKSWDYIAVPLPEGYNMNCKTEHPYDNNNMCFFNHCDITKVIERSVDNANN